MRRAPQRMCVACRRRRDKPELLRVVRTPRGVRFDRRQRLPGRGAYVCADPDCVARAARRGGQVVRRALPGAPEGEVLEALARIAAAVTDRHRPEGPRAPKELEA